MDFEKMVTEGLAEMVTACTESDTDKNFIIVIDTLAVEPDSQSDSGLKQGRPHNVKRYHLKDAQKIAKKCQNGNGTRGKAVYWRSETEDHINTLERALELMKKKCD